MASKVHLGTPAPLLDMILPPAEVDVDVDVDVIVSVNVDVIDVGNVIVVIFILKMISKLILFSFESIDGVNATNKQTTCFNLGSDPKCSRFHALPFAVSIVAKVWETL